MLQIVYFSSVSQNTHRFIQTLANQNTLRIPTQKTLHPTITTQPYILITPTYGAKYVPPQVIKFLSNPTNQQNLKGVIATGNINFGKDFAKAGNIISTKLKTPYLYRLELAGTPEDTTKINKGLKNYERQLTKNTQLPRP